MYVRPPKSPPTSPPFPAPRLFRSRPPATGSHRGRIRWCGRPSAEPDAGASSCEPPADEAADQAQGPFRLFKKGGMPAIRQDHHLGWRRHPLGDDVDLRARTVLIRLALDRQDRSEEHTSDLQSLMPISYA